MERLIRFLFFSSFFFLYFFLFLLFLEGPFFDFIFWGYQSKVLLVLTAKASERRIGAFYDTICILNFFPYFPLHGRRST